MAESKSHRSRESTMFLRARGSTEEVEKRAAEDDDIKKRLNIADLDLARLKAVADRRQESLADLVNYVLARTKRGQTHSLFIDDLYKNTPSD